MSTASQNDIFLSVTQRRKPAAHGTQFSEAWIAALVLLFLVPLGVWLLFFIGSVDFDALRYDILYFFGYCIGLAIPPLFIIIMFSRW